MPKNVPDTKQFPWDVALKEHLAQGNAPTTGGPNLWAVNPTVGVDGNPLGADHVGYTGVNITSNTMYRWSGTSWVVIMDSPKVVAGDKLVLYVSQNTGNDSNSGLASSTAWKTFSRVYQELMQYNFMEKQVDIYMGPGTYAIAFPTNMNGIRVRLYGASSSSVTVQSMNISNMTVIVQGVTLGYPEFPNANTYFNVVGMTNSTVSIGPDVVLGPIGTFATGRITSHFTGNNSQLNFYANCPVSITGSSNTMFFMSNNSRINYVGKGWNNSSTSAASPSLAPAVGSGAVYDNPFTLSASDLVCVFNCVGSIAVDTFLAFAGASGLGSSTGTWLCQVNGNITGKIYSLTDGSNFNGSIVRGAASGYRTMGIPTTMSAGTKDASSTSMAVF